MSIQSIKINTTNTVAYTSTDETAITIMSFCNYGIADASITLHIVKNTITPSDDNIFIKDVIITPGDTYIVYSGGEKIILEDGDYINAIASVDNSITSITSYLRV